MTRKVPAVAAAMLVLAAFASVPVAAVESVTVETNAPSDVTADSATLHATVTDLEDASEAAVWFEYHPDGDEANVTSTPALTITGTGAITVDVTDLESGTTYVVEAHAETANATSSGSQVTFTTDAEEAVAVETDEATDVTAESATLAGELTLEGVENATVWFEYWETGDPANATTTATQVLDATGSFTASVTGLENGTDYVYTAHATAGNESDVGEPVEFTTHDRFADLAVDTRSASDVDNTSATLNGELTRLDGEAEAEGWFEYWVQGDPANVTSTENQTLTEPGSFSASVSGLENETTYVYVSHAAANGSHVTGDPVTFTTGQATTGSATWDGEGAFGQWLTSVLKNLVPSEMDVPFGQFVSDIVTANNPGNGQGPPEHAGPPDDDDDERGPPDHAKDDDDEDDEEDGPPDHAKGGDDDGDDEDELDVTVVGDLEANATVTVSVTHNGSTVDNATVKLNGEVVGTTEADGQLAVTLPDELGDEVEIEVETEDAEGEWEHEFEDGEDDEEEEEEQGNGKDKGNNGQGNGS